MTREDQEQILGTLYGVDPKHFRAFDQATLDEAWIVALVRMD